MAAKSWVMVRLQWPTHARLRLLRDRLMDAYGAGKHRVADMADGLSIDALIVRLLDQHQRHGERRKQQLARRKSQRGRRGGCIHAEP